MLGLEEDSEIACSQTPLPCALEATEVGRLAAVGYDHTAPRMACPWLRVHSDPLIYQNKDFFLPYLNWDLKRSTGLLSTKSLRFTGET